MRARIVYRTSGTTDVLNLCARNIRGQIWDGGRALVRLNNGRRDIRAVMFRRAEVIDVDKAGTVRFRRLLAGLAVGVVVGWYVTWTRDEDPQ